MDGFSKIRESAEREEQKRQMINKAIDLLHKLANKRLDYDEAKSEISRVVSEYYVIDQDGVVDNSKINLEVMINNSFDILSGIQDEKLNLYQAIMLINKVMAHKEPIEIEVKKNKKGKFNEIKQHKKEVDLKDERVRIEKQINEDPFAVHMNQVIENQRKLRKSIEELNEILKSYGFTLRAIEPK